MRAVDKRFEFAPPKTAGLSRALVLAVLAHVVLLIALTWGTNWKKPTSIISISAELWSAVPQEAAPTFPQSHPPASPVKPLPEVANVSIAIEQAKQRIAQEKLQAEEQQLRQKREIEKKLAQDRRNEAENAKKLESLRQANIARMARLANANGASLATGTAQQSSAPSTGYAERIQTRIKQHTTFVNANAANPTVVIIVRTSSNGTITSRRIVTPSGNKAWDESILRAIDKMESIPLDTDGKIPRVLLQDGLELTVSLH
ncbi:MAG: hypothetical protein RL211_209 [Pseudomonadota bacterium]|jgi:colicin import membrane protein